MQDKGSSPLEPRESPKLVPSPTVEASRDSRLACSRDPSASSRLLRFPDGADEDGSSFLWVHVGPSFINEAGYIHDQLFAQLTICKMRSSTGLNQERPHIAASKNKAYNMIIML